MAGVGDGIPDEHGLLPNVGTLVRAPVAGALLSGALCGGTGLSARMRTKFLIATGRHAGSQRTGRHELAAVPVIWEWIGRTSDG